MWLIRSQITSPPTPASLGRPPGQVRFRNRLVGRKLVTESARRHSTKRGIHGSRRRATTSRASLWSERVSLCSAKRFFWDILTLLILHRLAMQDFSLDWGCKKVPSWYHFP